jgi:hypothetical protein
MSNKRVLYILDHYPQISETYIENEIRQLVARCELRILALKPPNLAYRSHFAYTRIESREQFAREVRAFRPDVIHGHYTVIADVLAFAAQLVDRPFTLRAHSFDVLGPMIDGVRRHAQALTDRRCIGILTFPFTREILTRVGVRDDIVHGCWPVVDFARFHDERPNGTAVMNVGACIPKKNMDSYVRLGALVRERELSLYAMGYDVGRIQALNEQLGRPIRISEAIQPEDMPAEYKKHEWLVYTASPEERSVGWPMAVAEAQASGVGVCMQNIRPDLEEYVGAAGYLFDRIEDAAEIIRQPFPEAMRRKGFEHARKSDVRQHIHLLENLWQAA